MLHQAVNGQEGGHDRYRGASYGITQGDRMLGAGDRHRRHPGHHQGVDVGPVHGLPDRRGQPLGADVDAQVDRGVFGDLQAGVQTEIDGENAEGAGVSDDADPIAGRHRLGGEQLGDVECGRQTGCPDHPGLLEEGGDRDVGQLRGTGGQAGCDEGMPAGLHRDDRFGPGQHPGQPGELPRVAERLEIQQHDLGPVVAVPVLQQVVAGDVGPVTGGDEGGQPQPAVRGVGQDRDTERTGLAEETDATRRRDDRRQRRVHPDVAHRC